MNTIYNIKQTLLSGIFFLSLCGNIFAQDPTIQWQKDFGGSGSDNMKTFVQTSDSGYLVAGVSASPADGDKTEGLKGIFDYWILKLNSSGSIEWQNVIGGIAEDQLMDAFQTSDGGYFLAGYSRSPVSSDKSEGVTGGIIANYDYWVVKLDASGNIEWDNTIGGSDNDYLRDAQQTADGGYILAGYTKSPASGDKTEGSLGFEDYWIVKLNSGGVIEWQNTIGGGDIDYLYSIDQTSDGGYILGGGSKSLVSGDKTEYLAGFDYWLVKTDALGNIEWQNTIGGSSSDYLRGVKQIADGGYVLGGKSHSPVSFDKTAGVSGTADVWMIRTDGSGNIIYQNTIGTDEVDEYNYFSILPDGGFILAASADEGIIDDYNYWILRLDERLNIMWQDLIGGYDDDFAECVIPTSDNGYLIGGYSESGVSEDKTVGTHPYVGDNVDYWILKTNPDNCVPVYYYYDTDLDLYGDDNVLAFEACENPVGMVLNNTDCDDNRYFMNPSRPEFCNQIDDNCDGATDEGLTDCTAAPAILAQNNIGGASYETAMDVEQTNDGGYIVCGHSSSEISGDKANAQIGGDDFWILKLDASLNISWQRTLGTIKEEESAALKPLADGTYILAGSYNIDNVNYWEYKVYKLNASGGTVWQTTLGGTDDDFGRSIVPCSDGGFLVGGTSSSPVSGTKTAAHYGNEDYWIVKLASNGTVQWQKSYGGVLYDYLTSMIQTADGGFLLGGYSNSGIAGNKTTALIGNYDYWVVKTDASGNIEWQKSYGGTDNDDLYDIKQTPDLGYILFGESESPVSGNKTSGNMGGGYDDFWLIKTDNSGNIVWQNTVGSDFNDRGMEVEVAGDGSIYTGGYSDSWLTGPKALTYKFDYWIMKFSDEGSVIWQKIIGGSNSESLNAICLSEEGNIVMAGNSSSPISGDKTENIIGGEDYWVVKLESDCLTATEICNGFDDNCNGLTDDGVTESISISAGGATTFCQGGSVLLSATHSGASVQWKKNGANIAGATSLTYSPNKSGSYTAVTTSACGTATSNTIVVTINKNPSASISAAGSTTFCAGGNVTLNVVPVAGSTYQWYKGASALAGATATSYIATTAGNYKCRVTKTATGCYKNSNTITVTVPCRDGEITNHTITNNSFTVFPNPNNGSFTISLVSDNVMHGENRSMVNVFNSLGEVIYSTTLVSAMQDIELDNIPAGIYVIQISDGMNSSEQKLMIE